MNSFHSKCFSKLSSFLMRGNKWNENSLSSFHILCLPSLSFTLFFSSLVSLSLPLYESGSEHERQKKRKYLKISSLHIWNHSKEHSYTVEQSANEYSASTISLNGVKIFVWRRIHFQQYLFQKTTESQTRSFCFFRLFSVEFFLSFSSLFLFLFLSFSFLFPSFSFLVFSLRGRFTVDLCVVRIEYRIWGLEHELKFLESTRKWNLSKSRTKGRERERERDVVTRKGERTENVKY